MAAIGLLVLALLSGCGLVSTLYEVRSSNLPAKFEGFCIVQISDLHNQSFGPHQSQLLEFVRAAQPDLIAITGDLTDNGILGSEEALDLLRELIVIAPVYFVTGNHEIEPNLPEELTRMKNIGVNVLQGRSRIISREKETIAIAGIDDPDLFYEEGTVRRQAISRWKMALAVLRKTIQTGAYAVLLSHRPELITSYADLEFDLVLTGHAHGGQVRLPLIGAIYASNQGLFPRYTSGEYTVGKTRMIVSRGLGNSGVPFRILNRPELVVVRLKRKAE